MIIRANGKNLSMWSTAVGRARYDYDDENLRLEEMLNDDFFGAEWSLLNKGDYITITDCEDRVVTVRVDDVDRKTLKVYMSIVAEIHLTPVIKRDDKIHVGDVPLLAYRWRSSKAGGHSIVTDKGEVVGINYDSKLQAENAIQIMYKSGVFKADPQNAPVEPFVKRSKIFEPRMVEHELHEDVDR